MTDKKEIELPRWEQHLWADDDAERGGSFMRQSPEGEWVQYSAALQSLRERDEIIAEMVALYCELRLDYRHQGNRRAHR